MPCSATTLLSGATNRCSTLPVVRNMPLLIPSAGLDREGTVLIKLMRFDTKHICTALTELENSFTGPNYAACLEDSSSGGGGRSELVIFSSSTPGNFTSEQCNSVCFAASHRYGGLGGKHECLCSTNSEPNFISESQCSAACTNPQVMEVCRHSGLIVASLCYFVSSLVNITFRISSKSSYNLPTTSLCGLNDLPTSSDSVSCHNAVQSKEKLCKTPIENQDLFILNQSSSYICI